MTCNATVSAGCCLSPPGSGASEAGLWMRLAVAALIAAQSMTFGLAINLSPPAGETRLVLHGLLALSAVAVFLLTGVPLCRTAWQAVRQRKIVFEHLFLAGIFGAFFASLQCSLFGTGHVYYEVVAILLAIHTLGRAIGEKSRRAAWAALDQLENAFDSCALVLPDGTLRTVPVTEVRRGSRVRVAVGGAIPVDGVLVEGMGFVRETALSGEPFPAIKRPGDPLRAGSFSLDAALTVESTGSGRSRELDALCDAVRRAREKPGTLQREADRIVTWFLPSVMAAALATFLFWASQVGWQEGIFFGLAVLVVACPCSMGLATPLGLQAALTALARRGLIAHESELILRLARTDCVVFDKTGTLGEPEMGLVDLVTIPGLDRGKVRRLTAAVESAADHPVARAFRHDPPPRPAAAVRMIPGAGICGTVEGILVTVGNEHVLPAAEQSAARALRHQLPPTDGASLPLFILFDGRCVAAALLREVARASAGPALAHLEKIGIPSLILTGDRSEAAAAQGWKVPIEAGLSPAEKAARIARIQEGGRKVLFVGDGVNDTPAMTAAAAAIALGSGSAVARESAQGELVGGDLSAIPDAILLCRQTVKTLRGNLIFALLYNALGITLAALGILHPVAAAVLMMVSSLTVTWRALRGTRVVPNKTRPATHPRPSAGTVLTCAAIAIQGPLLGALGGFPPAGVAILSALFLVPALAAWRFLSRRPSAASEMILTMFSFGGAFMLAGMALDGALRPLGWEGICSCCGSAPASPFTWSWMETGMVAAALPCLFQRLTPSRLGRWLTEVVGMIAGMKTAAWITGGLPEGFSQALLMATYMSMMTGMLLGMLAGRQLAARLPALGLPFLSRASLTVPQNKFQKTP